jgi:hypothetical protein
MAEKRCFLCGRTNGLENHHIFGGSNRKHSTKYKLLVKLCAECHRYGKNAAHLNAVTSQKLHEYGQHKFMREQGATIADFVKIFGRNFLDEEW